MKIKDKAQGPSRRTVLGTAAGAASVAGAMGLGSAASAKNGKVKPANGHPILSDRPVQRTHDAIRLRFDAARDLTNTGLPRQETSGDDGYADRRASFTKTLPHNEFGEVDTAAYQKLLDALDSRDQDDFNAIPLSPLADRKLANPQGAYKFELTGLDGQLTWMRPAPKFVGLETAAEMGELYWKAACRDIPFSDYETSSRIANAAADLNGFSQTVGPKDGGSVTPLTIFRGETPGDLTGPYISQFLFKPIPFGNGRIEQRYDRPARGDDFMSDWASYLAVQRGVAPTPLVKGSPRYISDARALGEFVHVDFTFQAYQSAALIILGIPGAFDIGNLYNTNATQGAFVSLGGPDVLDLVSKAGNLSLTGAWYQKWLVHRRLRPEAYGGRLTQQLLGNRDYGLPDEIIDSRAVRRTQRVQGNALLSQAFPEGSPTHPAYPAGHATIAGACCTVLKAFFEESMEIPNPVVSNRTGTALDPYAGTLTIGGEIDKLANNIALGRDWAGVHYRSDGVDGLLVGEQQAIGLLRDYSRTYNERFDGFSLTKFDGTRIRINRGEVYAVGA